MADLDGASSLPGLWVAGEASCNGVMGANRLASNSLLDGMVFGPRVVEAIDRGVDGPRATGRDAVRARRGRHRRSLESSCRRPMRRRSPSREELQRTMTVHAGVLRSAESLAEAAAAVRRRGRRATTRVVGAAQPGHRRSAPVRRRPGARGEPRRPHPHRLRRPPATTCASASSPAADRSGPVGSLGAMTDTGNPANWHPDPFGRHELRYWDGTQWTEHVSSHGKQSIDPPSGQARCPPRSGRRRRS